tara:strand:- start:982 stop:3480 length:2499 start_codon:yes stop_codon:yes gene_type:complete
MVINQGVESKMSMQKPVFEDATLQKEFEESVTKVSEYYTVTKNGKTLDSYYSVNEINAKFNSLDVNMNKQQTDIKSEKVNNETLNNENVSANQNVIESNMTKGIADSDISIFGNNLDTLNTSLNELNSETYKTDIDLGDGKTLSVDTKGVDVTTRNSITSNVEGAVARSFVGAVDNSFISNDMQIDMGNGNTATVSQLMKSPTAQMGVYESIKQAINSNSDFTISTGSAELDTILIDQYKPVVASINRSSEGMKKDITTKITSATTLLRSGITAEKELAVASRAYNSVISGQHDDTLTKTDTSKQIVNAIYTQNNVGPSFFSTTESLDPNHPATKTMYQMARNGVFDETFIANVNMLVDGKLSNPQQVFALMNHIQQLSAVVNDAGTKEISLFHMAKGDIGANVSDATLAKIEMLNYMINLKGLNAQTANELNGDLIKISEMKSKLTYSGGETPAKIFVSDYALSKDSENANQYKDMHDVLRHHFTETHQEDAPSVINRMAGISKFLTNSNPTLGVDEVLGVLDMIYQKGYMNSNGIIIDPDLRNNEKVQTKYNIDALIPKNELEIFQAKPFDPSQGDFDENYSRFNGMQKQDVWLALIEETLSNKDAMQLYGDMDFVLDTRGTDTGKFNFGAYNPSIQPEVTDTDNIVGTRTLQSERSYLFKEIQNRSGGSLANIRKTQGDKGVQKAIKEREEFQKRLNAINQGEITDSGETTINVYGTKKAPVKVFLVPMKNIMMEQAPDTRGADGGKKTIKFRVMKLSDNGLELEPIMINAPVGDGNSAYVPYVVSYRGANDISPLDYLSISQLENAQKVRSEDVIKDMQPKTFNLDDL